MNRTTALGRTALHVAAASGHGKIVDTLLLNGNYAFRLGPRYKMNLFSNLRFFSMYQLV